MCEYFIVCLIMCDLLFVFHCLFRFIFFKAEGFSGADLAALLREAGLDVLRRLKNNEAVEGRGCTFWGGGRWGV